MGCCVSNQIVKFPKNGMHLYSREGRMLYTLIYSDACEYLLMNSVSHDVVRLSRVDNISMDYDHIVLDGWVNPGWWISACWFFMFDETHKRLVGNNYLVQQHYLRVELSNMSLTSQHKKMGIAYLVSIGTHDNTGELTVFSEVMYGMR